MSYGALSLPFLRLLIGYDVVLSNTDYVYMDCGTFGWTNPGGYWCQPYHEWQHLYNYISDVQNSWDVSGDSELASKWSEHVLGSETLAWGETISPTNIEQKLWPRTAGLAEALWGRTTVTANKAGSWYEADPRMQHWSTVMRRRGIDVEPLQAQWCDERGAYACTVQSGTPQ
jgi:hexosaminidase